MKTQPSIHALTLLALAAACASPVHPTQQLPKGPTGGTALTFNNHAHPNANDTLAPPQVCATFTLQPMSYDANGALVNAGDPVTIDETAASGNAASIEGCIDSTASGNDWAYLVTASQFVDCSTQQPIANLFPATVAQLYPFDCQAGVDVPVDIEVNVSIATPNAGGYVDIGATVGATEVQVGCKQADFDGDMLHFGESWFGQTGDTAPDGLWGLASQSAPQQWAGQVNASGQLDQYYTGQLQLDAPAQAAIIQTLVPSSCKATYVASDQPICTTTATADLGVNGQSAPAPTTSTTAGLADALIVEPSGGWAAASIQAGGSSLLLSGTATTSPIPAGAASSQNSPALADALTSTLSSFSDPSIAQFTGLWPSLDRFGFVFTFLDGSGNFEWGELVPSGSGWSIAGEYPLAGTDPGLLTCAGVFGSAGGCVQENDCSHYFTAQADPVKPRILHAAIKTESATPLAPDSVSATFVAQLEMPDGLGGLDVTPLVFDGNGDAPMDCSAAVTAGLTRGDVRLNIGFLGEVIDPASPIGAFGQLPETVLPYDCATGSAASISLAVPVVTTAADGTLQSATLEPKGAELALSQGKVTCAADSDGSGATDQTSRSSLAWSSEKFASSAACVLRVRTCSDDSGNAVDCGPLGIADTDTVDAENRRVDFVTSVRSDRAAAAKAAKIETYSIALSSEQQQSAFSIRYGAPFQADSRVASDSSCASSSARLDAAPAFVTGNLASGTFAYSTAIDSDGHAKVELVTNPVIDCGQTPSAPPINARLEQALDDGTGGVATDVCVDAASPDRVYLTTLGLVREPGDPRRTLVSAFQLDLTGATSPAKLDPSGFDIQAAASQCAADRLSGVSAAPRIATALMGSPVPAPPAPVENIGCMASGGGGCVCEGGFYGHMQGWLFFEYCKIDGNIAFGW